jgi:hypothetical protein
MNVGIAAGFLWGVIQAILIGGIFLMLLAENLGIQVGVLFGPSEIAPLMMVKCILYGIIGGAIFGVIYGVVYNSLPGTSSVVKGVVLSIIWWLVFGIAINYEQLAIIPIVATTVLVVLSLISAIIWGDIYWRILGQVQVKNPLNFQTVVIIKN